MTDREARLRRRRLVGQLAAVVMVAMLGVAWLITGPVRTAHELSGIVGERWVLTQVSRAGKTVAVSRVGDHTLNLQPSGVIVLGDSCNSTAGYWSWTLRGFEINYAATSLVGCWFAPGTAPAPPDPFVTSGVGALTAGSVPASLDGAVLTVGSDGYSLTYVRG